MEKVQLISHGDSAPEPAYLFFWDTTPCEFNGLGVVILWDDKNDGIDQIITVEKVQDGLYKEINYGAIDPMGSRLDLLARQLAYKVASYETALNGIQPQAV